MNERAGIPILSTQRDKETKLIMEKRLMNKIVVMVSNKLILKDSSLPL